MVSRKDDLVDFNKLEEEVSAAMEAEARYYRENDAKFRAINQRVATYEEFRDIVLASHLKPLDKKDKLDKIQWNQPWNQVAVKSNLNDDVEVKTSNPNNLLKKPMNGHEFDRDWRRLCKSNADKYAFVLWLGPDDIGKIFRAEISFGLLGDIVVALNDQYRSCHHHQVAAILKSLNNVSRFKLSLDFLTNVERQCCRYLFEKLLESCDSDDNTAEQMCQTCMEQECSDSNSCQHLLKSVVNREQIMSLKEEYGC